jgi:hypothetical protein
MLDGVTLNINSHIFIWIYTAFSHEQINEFLNIFIEKINETLVENVLCDHEIINIAQIFVV